MNVRPLRDRVLVKRVEAQEQRIGGIIIPDTAKKSRNKPKSSPPVAAASTTTGRRFRWTSRWAITCSSGSTQARRSSWMARNI
jgi:hypothetical protein